MPLKNISLEIEVLVRKFIKSNMEKGKSIEESFNVVHRMIDLVDQGYKTKEAMIFLEREFDL
ncbi:hypothetical protein COF51_06925 [Bacillus pseudomycoides]|uniref:hypothetical protein n=1 Tax=Bacillus pseudomycoides TaxID=64104 RepID=UPI000BF428B0|nr:hypothetical protein [Bacillus pseudomycoides]PGE98896.1 hypothetical protein COM62_03275 [Bacillus pseudomycoides]PHE39413.1 hypothetical protein COF51_06925 [Bacillus pseudomycoides]